MKEKELRGELENALTIIRNCTSDDESVYLQLLEIETKIMHLINQIF